MRLLRLDEIPPNTPLGQSIFDEFGHLLLGEGYPLREYELSRIQSLGYEMLYVNTPESEKITIIPPLSPRVNAQLRRIMFEQFDHLMHFEKKLSRIPPNKIVDEFERNADFSDMINIKQAVTGTQLLIEDLELKGLEPVDAMLLKGKVTYLRDHSLNTAIMAVTLGYRFGLRKNDLIEIALAAMYHCCGLVFFPHLIGRDEITFSAEDMALFRMYPTLSERAVSSSTDRFFRSRIAIQQHREKQDGSGFPKGLRGHNKKPNFSDANGSEFIYPMAEIIAVTAAFDEYVGRGFGSPMTLEEAGLNIIGRSGHDLNKGIVDTWLNTCSIFPPGVTIKVVRCSEASLTNAIGIVQRTNWQTAHKPRVVLLHDGKGKSLDQMEVDLAEFEVAQVRMIL